MILTDAWSKTIFNPKPSKRDKQRVRIINAAIKNIGSTGIELISFASVAKIIKMEPAHVVYYFKTKESLLLGVFGAVIVTAQHITMREVANADEPVEKIHGIVRGAFCHIREYPRHQAILAGMLTQSLKNKKCLALCKEARTTGFDRLQSLLGSERLARNVQSIVTGSVINAILRQASDEELTDICQDTIEIINLVLEDRAK